MVVDPPSMDFIHAISRGCPYIYIYIYMNKGLIRQKMYWSASNSIVSITRTTHIELPIWASVWHCNGPSRTRDPPSGGPSRTHGSIDRDANVSSQVSQSFVTSGSPTRVFERRIRRKWSSWHGLLCALQPSIDKPHRSIIYTHLLVALALHLSDWSRGSVVCRSPSC